MQKQLLSVLFLVFIAVTCVAAVEEEKQYSRFTPEIVDTQRAAQQDSTLVATRKKHKPGKKEKKEPVRGDDSFDYFVLALSWSGTACKALPPPCSVPSYINNFTVHGLWPNKNGTIGPFNCHDMPYDPTAISSLQYDLDHTWTDYLSKRTLWQHEWEKHGTCAISLPSMNSEYNYFATTLRFVKGLPLLAVLQSSGISPSNTQTYGLRQIQEAFINNLGVAPVPVCYKERYLQELRFCVDKSLRLFTCYDSGRTTCGSTILFPVTQH